MSSVNRKFWFSNLGTFVDTQHSLRHSVVEVNTTEGPKNRRSVGADLRLALSVADVAAATSTSVQFVRAQIRLGKLKALKVGRRILVTPDSARQWLEGD